MFGELKIAFDFKNSKEYLLLTNSKELNNNIEFTKEFKGKKCLYFEYMKPCFQNLGTYLLDFINTDFFDTEDYMYFMLKYGFIPTLMFFNPDIEKDRVFKRFPFKDQEILVLTEDEIKNYFKFFQMKYATEFGASIQEFKSIFQNSYYKDFLNELNPEENEIYGDCIKYLSENEKDFSAINDIARTYDNIGISFDLHEFEDNENIYEFYHSVRIDSIAYVCIRKFLEKIKSFRLVQCQNCGYYFIPKTAHTTLYCDEIFENGKTCKEYANSFAYSRTFANDPVCKRYRNRYKNLQKQASLSNNTENTKLFESYKTEGKLKIKSYQNGKISSEEMLSWIDSMKIRKI